MKQAILILSFTIFTATMCISKDKDLKPLDISDYCSFEQFNKIVDFVLKGKQTQTYCNIYNDNPYHQFNNGIEVYLNPKLQFPTKEQEKLGSTYNSITFVVRSNHTTENHMYLYTQIEKDSDANKIYLAIEWHETAETQKQRSKNVKNYLETIMKEIDRNK